MATLSPNQKLDYVLSAFKKTSVEDDDENLAILVLDFNEVGINRHESDAIAKKLVKDGYLDIDLSSNNHWPYAYRITFEGLFFTGYVKQEETKAYENNRLESIEKEIKENRRWTLYLTILVALGTLVAGVYYSIEIYKEIHAFCHSHNKYWIWENLPKSSH